MDYIKIENGILGNNTYLVYKNKDAVLIDPSFDYKVIDNVIEKNGFNLKAIFITHGHYDHIVSIQYFVDKYNVVVNGSKYSLESLQNPQYNLSELSPNIIDKLVCDVPVNLLVEGKQEIEGFNVEVIFTPGHSKGCTSFIFGKLLFTGDFIFKGTIGRLDLLSSSTQAMNESIRKFIKLNNDLIVLTGHGPLSTVEEECKTNIFVKEIGG